MVKQGNDKQCIARCNTSVNAPLIHFQPQRDHIIDKCPKPPTIPTCGGDIQYQELCNAMIQDHRAAVLHLRTAHIGMMDYGVKYRTIPAHVSPGSDNSRFSHTFKFVLSKCATVGHMDTSCYMIDIVDWKCLLHPINSAMSVLRC